MVDRVGASSTNLWGLPDWSDERAYPSKKWSESRWRWEFTRRRDDYRRDFNIHLEATVALMSELAKASPGRRFLAPNEPGFVVQCPIDCTERYGLGALPDPRISDHPFHVLMFQSLKGFVPGAGPTAEAWVPSLSWAEKVNWTPIPDGFAAVVLDLSEPLERQWRSIRDLLQEYQKEKFGRIPNTRRHPQKWLTYLRVLDAREFGASWAQIADSGVLGRNLRSTIDRDQRSQTARQVWLQAQDLMFNWSN